VPAKRRKARLGDALIAQTCIDQGISLVTLTATSKRLPKPQGFTRSPVLGGEGVQEVAEVIRPLQAWVWRPALRSYSRSWSQCYVPGIVLSHKLQSQKPVSRRMMLRAG